MAKHLTLYFTLDDGVEIAAVIDKPLHLFGIAKRVEAFWSNSLVLKGNTTEESGE